MARDRIVLTTALFQTAPDGVFQKAENQDAVYSFELGDIDATLSVTGICREFEIRADSDEGKTLALVVRALEFITALRLGDVLPSEVLTGKPSWEITPEHRLRAYHRLTLQLATWLTGEERVYTSADELKQMAEDPANKKKWNEAFDEAARRLGFAERGREQVVELLTLLANDLAYIEALRDRLVMLDDIAKRLHALRGLYERETSVREIADSVGRLLTIARRQFATRFQEIDAQTGEILSVLRNPTRQLEYIQQARDELYCRLFAWTEIAEHWEALPARRCEAQVALLRETYRFLALRYMPRVDWPLLTKLGPQTVDRRQKTAVVW